MVTGGSPAGPDPSQLGPCLGTVGDLPDLLEQDLFDDIILAKSDFGWETQLVGDLARSQTAHGSVLLLPGPFESLIGRFQSIDVLAGILNRAEAGDLFQVAVTLPQPVG